jgi:hypothetical protein
MATDGIILPARRGASSHGGTDSIVGCAGFFGGAWLGATVEAGPPVRRGASHDVTDPCALVLVGLLPDRRGASLSHGGADMLTCTWYFGGTLAVHLTCGRQLVVCLFLGYFSRRFKPPMPAAVRVPRRGGPVRTWCPVAVLPAC